MNCLNILTGVCNNVKNNMAVVEIRSKLDLGKYHGWVSVEKKKKERKSRMEIRVSQLRWYNDKYYQNYTII